MKLAKSAFALTAAALGMFLIAACTAPAATPVTVDSTDVPANASAGELPAEIIVYLSELPSSALRELDFIDDPASPGGKLVGLPNTGDELDPPPENDPSLTFSVPVQSGVPYRCWVHMKVGTPKGRSTANVVWVQFSDAIDQAGQEILRVNTDGYLTAQGPSQEGWTWVSCDAQSGDSLVYFPEIGEVTVRIQAGAEGVGIDQFLLSPAQFLQAPPTEPIVSK